MKSTPSLLDRFQFLGVIILTTILIVGLGMGLQFFFRPVSVSQTPTPKPTIAPPVFSPLPIPTPTIATTPLLPPRPKITSVPPAPVTVFTPNLKQDAQPSVVELPPQPSTDLGHLPYNENDRNRLVKVGMYYDRPEFLDQEAADAFKKMQADAQAQGVGLRIISGFRSFEEQSKLFERQIKRRGSRELAAKLSAPPGYSEHHTGYALDIGDGKQLNTDLKYEFESTAAYRWLAAHAYIYGFELSFQENNAQGVSFEPWHWRYRGSDRAKDIFAAAQ